MSAQGHSHSGSLSQNHKAQLANAYNELGKELSSSKIKVVGNYTLGRVIGEGTYGKVRLGTHRLTSTRVAIKQIPKAVSSSLTREIHHHRQLHHPHVTQMYEVIATESSIWIVTELCSGGELFDYLAEKGRLAEDETKLLFGQLCLAVAYLHDKGIVHRDLKLENILLDERCRIKLGDFGFTREFERGSFMETFCGTTGYASPEMLQCKKYQGPEVDIWSLGVILYCLLTGTLPFDDDNESVMREKIIKGDFEDPEWLSFDSRDLIQKILQKDPVKRLTIRQILSHSWFAARAPSPSSHVTPQEVFSSPSPESFKSASAELDRTPESPAASRTSHTSHTLGSTELDSSASTTLEDTSHSLLDTPKPNGAFVQFSSSDTTLTRVETYEEFTTRMAHLNTNLLGNHIQHRPSGIDNGITSDSSSALHPLSPSTPGPKAHPPSSVRTPVRTKRRSVSSNLSDTGSPSAEKSFTTHYPYQDFASLLNTPAPIIFSTSLERDLLTSLSSLGFDTAQIVHSVLSDACDAAGALWWMLKRKAEKQAMVEASESKVAAVAGTSTTAKASSNGTSSSHSRAVAGESTSSKRAVRATVSVAVQTDIAATHFQALGATRSAPQLAFVPPTPTFALPETPPKSRSPTQTHLSPSPTPGSSSRSHPSTPSGSLRDKEKDGSKVRRDGKARSGSVSIMQRATTALEAAGLVKKKSSEAVREEREREKSKESERRLASGEESRSSYGSSSSKLGRSVHGKPGRDNNASTATATPSTPPQSESLQHTLMGSPWVVTEATQQSPPNATAAGAPTPANSPSDPFLSPSSSTSLPATGKPAGSTRNRASLLTTFRLWFNDERRGKRKDSNLAGSAGTGGSSRGSFQNRMSMGGSGGTVKRRTSGTAANMSSRKVTAHRAQRASISSRRSSSANSRRSSVASAQILLLDPPHVIEQQQIPTRRSIGSHTPNSERGGDFSTSRPSSVRSVSGGQVHRKSPSASSASSAHFRTASPMQKYHQHHKRAGSGSSTTRVVRQIQPTHHHHHHHNHPHHPGTRHGRSNSASSSLYTPTSSRPTSFYDPQSENEVAIPRNISPFRPPGGRRSLDDSSTRRSVHGGSATSNVSMTTTTTTFVAQKRQAPFMSPSGGNSVGRSSWKKSWGVEPPGWQSRTMHLPIEVIAISPATGTGTTTGPAADGQGGGGTIRDVFSGKQSLSLGDESDWVDEDDDVPAFAGGLGQSAALALGSSSNSSSSALFAQQAVEPAAVMQLSAPPTGRRGMKRGSNRNAGGGGMTTLNTNRQKPGQSPIERPSPIPAESNYEASELRGGRRQLPSGRSGPAFRHAIQEEDEGEEE